MRKVDDPDDNSFIENLIDHPEFTPTRRVPPLESIAKRLTDAVGILREWTSNEFPTRDGHCFGQEISERLLRSFRQLDPIGHCGSRPAARISSVTSSSV